MNRNKQIVKLGIQGIIVNLILVLFKGIVGLISNSIAIILDAVNNLGDVLSSVITIIGTKLSEKRPNKKHPYGYGRIEYLTSIIIAIIVFTAGITAFKEALDKVINPVTAKYSIPLLIVIVAAVLVKYFFGNYLKKEGKKLESNSLVASGTDAVNDSILSLSTLIAAIISILFNISIEGYIGIIISILIIKIAIDILQETVADMIGERANPELIDKIRKKINSYDEVLGVYDIQVHNYGPNKIISTAHIQIDDELKAREIHRLTRRIEVDIYTTYGIILTLGIYASNDQKEYKEIKDYITKTIKEYNNIIQMHGFYVDDEYNLISFDLIFNFDETNPEKIVKEIKDNLKKKYPKYKYSIIIDADISD